LNRVVGLSLAFFLMACSSPAESKNRVRDAGSAAPDRAPAMAALPRGKVRVADAFGGAKEVSIEIAQDDESRQKGLMFRERLADTEGMLFIFEREDRHSFWMKNTLISLDMLFIGRDLKVVGIVERAEPQTLDARAVNAPSLYVLEVPGGWASRMGVRPGAKVELMLPAKMH
jgi:uncharacterized protein